MNEDKYPAEHEEVKDDTVENLLSRKDNNNTNIPAD
jgi:hypothetical protein